MSNWLNSSEDDAEVLHRGQLLRPGFYWSFLSRRWLYIIVPFLLISLAGFAIAAILPPTYGSEGKLIVQPQQISTELVRPTVTSVAQDRIQVIEQRTMSRDNLLEIAEKYQLFAAKRHSFSDDDFVELLKKNIKITVIDPAPDFGQSQRSRGTSPPVVFTVGFEYSDPVTAEQVASELIQRILNEDVRDRTERASNTTKFMTEEVKKLQAENAMLDAKVSELRASLRVAGPAESGSSESAGQLSELRNEYAQKSALYSEQHPVLKLLRRQIQALESTKSAIKSTDAEGVATLDALVAKQEAARKTLDQANAKLTSAQAGENLERNQQSEKLDVIERPTVPQRALKPNRLKLALTAMVAALGSGIVLAYLVEALDTRIRSSGDLVSIIDRQLIVPIPFISNRADMRRKTAMLVFLMLGLLAGATAASYSAQPLIPHFNDLVTKTRAGFTN